MSSRDKISFLEECAAYLLNTQADISTCCLVFPNRRSGRAFLAALQKMHDKPIWIPDIYSISDLAHLYADIQEEEHLPQMLELYKICRDHGLARESFAEFYGWGNMLLQDFNDIELYFDEKQAGLSPVHIFNVLEDHKEIEARFGDWKEEQKQALREYLGNMKAAESKAGEDDLKGNFNIFWSKLPEIFSAFRDVLLEKKKGYEGLVFKRALERLEQEDLPVNYNKVLFVGFNNLSKCEERIICHFMEKHTAEVIWDADSYYVTNAYHEAGHFIRQYKDHKLLSPSVNKWLKKELFDKHIPEVEIIGTPSNTGMAKTVAAELISGKTENAAIILPDKNLLFPVLHSLPEELATNITMGYPIQQTLVYSFIDELLQLQRSALERNDEYKFHHKPLTSLLRHPYLAANGIAFTKFVWEIENNNMLFARPARLIQVLESLEIDEVQLNSARSWLEKALVKTNGESLLTYILDNLLYISQINAGLYLESDLIKLAIGELSRLQESIKLLGIEEKNADLMAKLVRQVLRNITIPFETEDSDGIQVMGTLESRNLDFEHVYILSMNEGKLPPANDQHSFIPFSLRKAFGLPTTEEREAMYSYYFYRLLQRASKVTLLYNTEPDELGGGDISRLLLQLKYETFREPDNTLKEAVIGSDVKPALAVPISIEKEAEDVFAAMQKFLEGESVDGKEARLSPSALNTYLECGLRFYFHYVAGIKEADEIQDEMDAATFGNILHLSMESMYQGLIGKNVSKEDILSLKQNLKEIVHTSFREVLYIPPEEEFEYDGRNMLIRDAILKYIGRILDEDARVAPFEIVAIEAGRTDTPEAQQYMLKIPVSIHGKQYKLRLGGVIDRVDKAEGYLRIVDYKTGSDDTKFDDIEALFSAEPGKRNKVPLQTLLYGLIYHHANPQETSPLSAAVYSVKKMFDESFSPRLKMGKEEITDISALLPEFEQKLHDKINEIFDLSKPFSQTEDSAACVYCPYSTICHREQQTAW